MCFIHVHINVRICEIFPAFSTTNRPLRMHDSIHDWKCDWRIFRYICT